MSREISIALTERFFADVLAGRPVRLQVGAAVLTLAVAPEVTHADLLDVVHANRGFLELRRSAGTAPASLLDGDFRVLPIGATETEAEGVRAGAETKTGICHSKEQDARGAWIIKPVVLRVARAEVASGG